MAKNDKRTAPQPEKLEIPVHCSYSKLEDPAKLRPNPGNPNRHSKDQIARLKELVTFHGWRHSVIVSTRSNLIVVGHARHEVAKQLGCLVPVDYQDFKDDASETAFLLSDNQIAELAELDTKAAAMLLDTMKDNPALQFTGFSEDEMKKMRVEVSAHTRTPGPGGNPVVQYAIIFDNTEQQEIWYAFLRDLKEKFPKTETTGQRLSQYLASPECKATLTKPA